MIVAKGVFVQVSLQILNQGRVAYTQELTPWQDGFCKRFMVNHLLVASNAEAASTASGSEK